MQFAHMAVSAALLLLAACTAEPQFARPDPGGTLEARRLLAEAAAAGPVPLQVIGAPPAFPPERVASLAAEGVSALDVRFAPGVPGLPRLVMAFGRVDPEILCRRPPATLEPGSPTRLTAAFCDAAGSVAAIAGTAGGPNVDDMQRLIWRTTARLFPDDYAETYGFNLFGGRFRLGLGGSFGF